MLVMNGVADFLPTGALPPQSVDMNEVSQQFLKELT
jgi:hypothetical protein